MNGLVTVAEGAKLARLESEVLLEFAMRSEEMTIKFGPGGPWLDPDECEGLGHIADGIEDFPGGRERLSSGRAVELKLKQ